MTRHIALLRGINVGPHRRIAMPALRELLTGAGYGDVRTYVQSGNIVLDSDAAPERLAQDLQQLIADGLGVDTPVVVRTREELADVVARNPLSDVADDPKRYQVSFLSAALDPAVAEELNAADLEPERLVADGREVYIWHANGIIRSPAGKLVTDRKLGVTATARNWRTVTTLLEMAEA